MPGATQNKAHIPLRGSSAAATFHVAGKIASIACADPEPQNAERPHGAAESVQNSADGRAAQVLCIIPDGDAPACRGVPY
jgi:hypothetical protein